MAEHGIAAPIGDHNSYDVSREGPARLVAPVQHLQVGGGCPNLDKGMLATFKLFNDLNKFSVEVKNNLHVSRILYFDFIQFCSPLLNLFFHSSNSKPGKAYSISNRQR